MGDFSNELHKCEIKASKRHEIIDLTERLVDSIGSNDFDTYKSFCDPLLTAFEPESMGHLIEGIDYHKFTFDNLMKVSTPTKTRVLNPIVKLLGPDAACIAYVRFTQFVNAEGKLCTSQTEETRVWQKRDDKWVNVHVHRSGDNARTVMR